MTLPGYDAWRLRGPERHEVGTEPGDTCGRYAEPDEDAPRNYRPNKGLGRTRLRPEVIQDEGMQMEVRPDDISLHHADRDKALCRHGPDARLHRWGTLRGDGGRGRDVHSTYSVEAPDISRA
jgi:hypothetical protein